MVVVAIDPPPVGQPEVGSAAAMRFVAIVPNKRGPIALSQIAPTSCDHGSPTGYAISVIYGEIPFVVDFWLVNALACRNLAHAISRNCPIVLGQLVGNVIKHGA